MACFVWGMVARTTRRNSLASALVQERNEQKNAQPESEAEQRQSKPRGFALQYWC